MNTPNDDAPDEHIRRRMKPTQIEAQSYKRCEFIIRQFMSVDKPTAELLARFHGWLLNGRHCREKNVIIRRLFYEAMTDTKSVPPLSAPSPLPPYPNVDSASGSELLEKLLA